MVWNFGRHKGRFGDLFLVYALAFNSSDPLNVYLLMLLPSLPLRKVQLGESQFTKDQQLVILSQPSNPPHSILDLIFVPLGFANIRLWLFLCVSIVSSWKV